MIRCRITYQKTESLRYTGNLDVQKIWERFVRRAGLPVAYSQGFHPQARIQQACPLPLGFLSIGEQLDLFLDDDNLTAPQIAAQLASAPYPGITITEIHLVDLISPSLASRLVSAEYRVEFLDPVILSDLHEKVVAILTAPQLLRSRRDKSYDLRPLIERLEIEADGAPVLCMQLSARQSATGRPDEVVSSLGYDPFSARYTRTGLIFTS